MGNPNGHNQIDTTIVSAFHRVVHHALSQNNHPPVRLVFHFGIMVIKYSNVLIAQAQLQFIEKRSVVTPNSSNFRFSDLSDQTIRIFWALGLSPSPTPVSNSPPSFLTYREISSPPFTSHKKGP